MIDALMSILGTYFILLFGIMLRAGFISNRFVKYLSSILLEQKGVQLSRYSIVRRARHVSDIEKFLDGLIRPEEVKRLKKEEQEKLIQLFVERKKAIQLFFKFFKVYIYTVGTSFLVMLIYILTNI